MLHELLAFIKAAGASTEQDTDRDGFLSYHAESHALAMGIAAGWALGAIGETRLLSLVYGAAVYGNCKGATGKRKRILKDVAQEWHYALLGLVIGSVLGVLVGRVVGVESIPLPV